MKRILLYGTIGGLLIALLKLIEYQHFVRVYPTELYGGLVAVIFTAVGKYAAISLEKMRNSGASASEIAEAQKKMAEFKVLYKNPLFNIGITFLEVFPVGLIVTLVSAAILRRKMPEGAQPAAAAA